MSTTPDYGLPEIAQSQANADVTHNEAIQLLQALNKGAIDRGLNPPPGAPTNGDVYIVGTAPTGAWAGRANAIAVYVAGVWTFIPGYDSAGAAIAIGARHEGLALWVQDENQYYVWTGAAWAAYTVTAANVVNTPAGNIAATDVQAAINELDTEKVAKAGDTMTSRLNINNPSSNLTPLSISVTDGVCQMIAIRDDTTPAAGILFSQLGQGDDSAGNITTYGNIRYQSSDVTDGSEDGFLEIRTVAGGTLATRVTVTQGLHMNGAGVDQGSGTINATAIYTQARLSIDNDSVLRARVFTVATLPAVAAGKRAHVSDSNATTTAGIGAVVAGGGANSVPVYSDAAAWRIG